MNITELQNLLSPEQVLTDQLSLETYGRDWCKHYQPSPRAICFPKNTQEVQKLVKWARKNKIPLVPSGGRTGLSGGATATHQEVVVNLEKMNRILNFNPIDRQLTCEAGVITEVVQEYCRDKDCYFPVDFAARGSSQIGGNIATNAGGLKVVRYGMMREWVKGLTVVTGEGEILNLKSALIKNATGFDLKQLFIGTEGTMGIITEAVLGFTHAPKESSVMIIGLANVEHVLSLFELFMQKTKVNAFEIFTDEALKQVMEQTELPEPLSQRYKYNLLIEVETASEAETETLMEAFSVGQEKGWILDGTMSQSPSQAQQLWQYRERISESLAPRTPHKNDISVAISKIPDFLERIDKMVSSQYPGFEVIWFGHIGDGNLHLNILRPQKMTIEEFKQNCDQLDKQLFSTIQDLNGSISAEHGIGLTKKAYLHYSRTPEELHVLKALKRQLDPDNIINPGKLFEV